MRIEGTLGLNAVGSRKNAKDKKSAGKTFKPASTLAPKAPAPNIPMNQTSGIEAMLALQGVDTQHEGKQRTIRHGLSMLDTLDEIKADLLTGNIGEGRLNKLLAQVSRARQQGNPELLSLIDDIDLLAKVELAKLGKFVN